MIRSLLSFLRRVGATTECKLVIAWMIVVIVTAILDPNHTYWERPEESWTLIRRYAVLLDFFALGSSVIIISGGIDLSCGSVIALSATVFGMLLYFLDPDGFKAGDIKTWVFLTSFAGTLLLGLMIGTLHAWLITNVGLPPFIATLATLVGLRSFGRALSTTFLGKSQIDFPGEKLRTALSDFAISSWLFIVFAIALILFMTYTVMGRHLYAMGGNEQAAKLSGIRTDRLKWFAYSLGAITSSFVGIVCFAEFGSAKPDILARGYELNAIAASVIGGCSLQGGVGTLTGTVLGCIFLRTVIDSVNKMVGTGADVYEGMIVGIVVVLAVTFSQRGKAAQSALFHTTVGWAVIPTLSLLASILYVLFLSNANSYQWWHAGIFGGVVFMALIVRALMERSKQKSIVQPPS
jgi:ribose/xylose/arabinose/galactoside ABC-type transport system permease subunit